MNFKQEVDQKGKKFVKICFVDNTNFKYDSSSINSEKLRGAETVLINLSRELNILGNQITIINNCPSSKVINTHEIKGKGRNQKLRKFSIDRKVAIWGRFVTRSTVSWPNIFFICLATH